MTRLDSGWFLTYVVCVFSVVCFFTNLPHRGWLTRALYTHWAYIGARQVSGGLVTTGPGRRPYSFLSSCRNGDPHHIGEGDRLGLRQVGG